MSLIQDLQKIGLSEKSVRVYLAGLELGPSPVQAIAKKSGVNRVTTYVILDELAKDGLFTTLDKGKKRLFQAEGPERLQSVLHKEKAALDGRMRELERLMPELRVFTHTAKEQPRVRFFEGKEGIAAIQDDIMHTKMAHFDEFAATDYSFALFPLDEDGHRNRFAGRILKEKIPAKILYTSSKGKVFPDHDGTSEFRFLPADKFPFATEMAIYGGKVAFFSLSGKLIGVIVEHKGIHDMMHGMFHLSWEAAGHFKEERAEAVKPRQEVALGMTL